MLSDEEVLAAVRGAGVEVSLPQFSRWLSAGLLPEPERPGRGRGKGRSARRHAPEVVAQVVALARLLASSRSFHEAGWKLAALGHPVRRKFIEEPFARAAARWDEVIPHIHRELGTDDGLERIADRLGAAELDAPLLRQMRKALGKRLEFGLDLLLNLATGHLVSFSPEVNAMGKRVNPDTQALDAILGLTTGRTDKTDAGVRLITGDYTPVLSDLAKALDGLSLSEHWRAHPLEDFIVVLRQLALMFAVIRNAGGEIRRRLGRTGFGLGRIALLTDLKADDQAMLVLLWHRAMQEKAFAGRLEGVLREVFSGAVNSKMAVRDQ